MSTGIILMYVALPALAFGVAYLPLTMIVRSVDSAYPKADVRRRFLAVSVDSLLLGILLLALWRYYLQTGSAWFILAGAALLLVRDGLGGRSLGKFLCGLVVIDLRTKRPAGIAGSAQRNFLFVLPGANLVALVLEARTIHRDPRGQRLGDRFAFTQVVDGFGVKDLAESFAESWANRYGMTGDRVRLPED